MDKINNLQTDIPPLKNYNKEMCPHTKWQQKTDNVGDNVKPIYSSQNLKVYTLSCN